MRFVALLLAVSLSNSSLANCINMEGSQLVVEGVVSKESFPGPPNYESIEEGDVEESNWFVTLKDPICVKNSYLDSVSKLQLFFEPGGIGSSTSLIEGKRYAIDGVTFMGLSGHHRTPILIEVTNIVGIQQTD